jgi:acetyl-CoA carboxylase biotin carboxylase subunit
MKHFKKILVANRGEIACRVFHTLREMEIASVAVFSDADRNSLHTELADEGLYIGPSSPHESYLNQEVIIEAAKKAKADAIHPGYGFLSENAEFAQKVIDAGIVFIGPSPESIRLMGDKVDSRRHMQHSGIAVVPGTDPITDQTLLQTKRKLSEMGYPVLLKASAGGGGKGMRLVQGEDQLETSLEASRREAQKAFGSDLVYAEKFIVSPRHIEFQILGDGCGNAIHLNERECSIQRRHQKVIEESPSTAVSPKLRKEMGEAAVKAAQSIQYAGAGTIEFILDATGRFYFLEMNTRLQVEHPITELTTGIDLVREQIQIAEGQGLRFSQIDIKSHGQAIECRIYAEDPGNHFLPQAGKIHFLQEPKIPGVRCDSGFKSGDTISTEYDPLISKLSVHATTRSAAIQKMKVALKNYIILGTTTNRPFLMDLIGHEAFARGETDTSFIEKYFANWKPSQRYGELAQLLAKKMEEDGTCFGSEMNREAYGQNPWLSLRNWEIGI